MMITVTHGLVLDNEYAALKYFPQDKTVYHIFDRTIAGRNSGLS